MIFIVIVILSLITSYLIFTSGIFTPTNVSNNDIPFLDNAEEPEHLRPGMYGSPPSDQINVYDSKRPIELPLSTNIDSDLISNLQTAANYVYRDFSNNRNSIYYKFYLFYLYKLQFLESQNALTEKQVGDYHRILNTIGIDIDNKFNYFLDLIKLHQDKSYFNLKRSILNNQGNQLIFGITELEQIVNYILLGTNIPGELVILLKYKLGADAQELLDDLITVTGYNYYTVLEILEVVLREPPSIGMVIAGISNNNMVTANNVVQRGFWTRLYHEFMSNNIDDNLLILLKKSYMNETICRSILATVISSMKNVRISNAINDLIKLCKLSPFKLVYSFPYHFTLELIKDAISDNTATIMRYGRIDVTNIDHEYNIGSPIQNIDRYKNIYINFPTALQVLNVENTRTIDINMGNKAYSILANEYIINNYISFPNISISGMYLDINSTSNSGSIIIYNNHTSSPITISSISVYGIVQRDRVLSNKIPTELAFMDQRIILDSDILQFNIGKNSSDASTGLITWNSNTPQVYDVTSRWKNGQRITIGSNEGIQIKAKTVSSTFYRFVQIYGVFISLESQPSGDYLQMIVQKELETSVVSNIYNIKNIPTGRNDKISSFIFAIDIPLPANLPTLATRTDTYYIFNSILPETEYINYVKIDPTSTVTNGIPNTLIKGAINTFTNIKNNTTTLKNETGLISDRINETVNGSVDNFNNRNVYRIGITSKDKPAYIKRILFFGDTYPYINQPKSGNTPNLYLSDDSVLDSSVMRAFTMSNAITIDSEKSSIITRAVNTPSNGLTIDSNTTVYFQPITSPNEYGQNISINQNEKYVNTRAMFIQFATAITANQIKVEIINLTDVIKKEIYFYLPTGIAADANSSLTITNGTTTGATIGTAVSNTGSALVLGISSCTMNNVTINGATLTNITYVANTTNQITSANISGGTITNSLVVSGTLVNATVTGGTTVSGDGSIINTDGQTNSSTASPLTVSNATIASGTITSGSISGGNITNISNTTSSGTGISGANISGANISGMTLTNVTFKTNDTTDNYSGSITGGITTGKYSTNSTNNGLNYLILLSYINNGSIDLPGTVSSFSVLPIREKFVPLYDTDIIWD